MKLKLDKYQIELIDESNQSSDSTDNLFQYAKHYSNSEDLRPTTQIGIKLYEEDAVTSSAIIKSTGGASGIHQTSQILNDQSLVICCSESIFKLSVPEFNLEWMVKADGATCFQIYEVNGDFVIHGELNITRIGSNGHILWQNSGADIFTTLEGSEDFVIKNDIIEVTDWNNQLYKFDLDGNQLN